MDSHRKNIIVCILFCTLLAGGFLLCVFLPKSEYSYSERRALAAVPALTAERVVSGRFMTDFESYAADAFPYRDSFRTLKALAADRIFLRQDNNGIYESDGFLAAVEYPKNDASLQRAIGRFRAVCETYLTEENRVFFSVVPDKGCFLAPESGHLSMDYPDFERDAAAQADFAQYVGISDLLERDDYYRTDTHWRQERITDVAGRLLEAMGASDTECAARDYELHTGKQDFYGVYYGQAALALAPDTLCFLTNDVIDSAAAYDWQNDREIPVYDMALADGRDPYELFLSGPLSLVALENPKAEGDKRLVIFRDSFASSLAPLLLGGYAKVTLVDIRYIHPDSLGKLVDFEGCDVLFLYSTLVLNHSETIR